MIVIGGSGMRNREKEILNYILKHDEASIDVLMSKFSISRRTLYYDISRINTLLKPYGELVNSNHAFHFIGEQQYAEHLVLGNMRLNNEQYLHYEMRYVKILQEIFLETFVDRQSLASIMLVSESTVIQTIQRMKIDLLEEGIELYFDNGYRLRGNEYAIRMKFLALNIRYPVEDLIIKNSVYQFVSDAGIELVAFSNDLLVHYIQFAYSRLRQGLQIKDYKGLEEAASYSYFSDMKGLLKDAPNAEHVFLSAYIRSLPNHKSVGTDKALAQELILAIEQKAMIHFRDKQECINHLSRHLSSSYYRIKFQFPVSNPILEDIRFKYTFLFRLIKHIFQNTEALSALKNIRDAEIAFLVSYVGAYIDKDALTQLKRQRVYITCPNGITLAKSIQYQIEYYFPNVEIMGVISFSELANFIACEDEWVISTVDIPQLKNVITVSPILKGNDIERINETIFDGEIQDYRFHMADIIEIIKKHGSVHNEEGLIKDLMVYQRKLNIKKGGQYMLKDLITSENVNIVDSVESWEDAIKLTAQPLLKNKDIEQRYVQAMIDNVNQYGPYIVLADYFALPHSRPEDGVNQLSMSLLVVKNGFDMLGKQVKVVVVLAATDNHKHLKALASLTELFAEEDNIHGITQSADVKSIIGIVEKYS